MMIYPLALLKMRNVPEKNVEKIEHTFYIQRPSFLKFFPYKTMLKNIVETDRPQVTICYMQMARSSHSEYVKYIPFLLQQ